MQLHYKLAYFGNNVETWKFPTTVLAGLYLHITYNFKCKYTAHNPSLHTCFYKHVAFSDFHNLLLSAKNWSFPIFTLYLIFKMWSFEIFKLLEFLGTWKWFRAPSCTAFHQNAELMDFHVALISVFHENAKLSAVQCLWFSVNMWWSQISNMYWFCEIAEISVLYCILFSVCINVIHVRMLGMYFMCKVSNILKILY